MILAIFSKNLSRLLPKNATFLSLVHFSSSSSASKTLDPSPQSDLIAEFFINSCGLSSQKAASATKFISKSTSVEQVDSVRHFFKHHGFTDTSICKLITKYSRIPSADIEKSLQPNLQALREMGFTEAELQLIITSNPTALETSSAIPRIEFWRTFLGTNNNEDLVLVLVRNRGLITRDIVTNVAPKIAMLKEHGLSDADIIAMVKRGRGFITRSVESIDASLKRAKELGLDRDSPMFLRVLWSLTAIGSKFEERMEVFKGFGWSNVEILSAFKKAPNFNLLAVENIQKKMELLVGIAGCKPSYIASRPMLLSFSLEKRLKPRHCVIEILKGNNLTDREWDLYNIMCYTDKTFMERIILPYKERVPEIDEIYRSAFSCQIPH